MSPADTEAATERSGIGQPHALEARQLEQAPHPRIAGRHDGEHHEQEQLPVWLAKGIEIWRPQRRQDDQEHEWKGNDDARRRPSLRLQSPGLALDLLSRRDRGLQVGEKWDELAATGPLDQHGRCEHVKQWLGDAVASFLPGLPPPTDFAAICRNSSRRANGPRSARMAIAWLMLV